MGSNPITFYCSPFLLDMSTLFYQLAKIEHDIHAFVTFL